MTTAIVPFNIPRELAAIAATAPALFLPNEKTAERFFGFFTANIRSAHRRRAYYKAACRLADWCEGRALSGLPTVRPVRFSEIERGDLMEFVRLSRIS